MSCSRQCFDQEDKFFGYTDCETCPGRDDGIAIVATVCVDMGAEGGDKTAYSPVVAEPEESVMVSTYRKEGENVRTT